MNTETGKEPLMSLLVIQHVVANFESWKRAFDSDPLGRARNGVLSHAILRSTGTENLVVVHLEFASREKAEAFLPQLQKMWQRVGDQIGFGGAEGVQARVLDQVERVNY